MKVEEAIMKRRSIRKFKSKPIPNSLIYKILDAARLAPSGCNVQPWYFIIIKEKDTKKKLKNMNIFNQNFIYSAPVLIICCGNPDEHRDDTKEIKYQIKEGTLPSDAIKKLPCLFKGHEVNRTIRDVAIASSYLMLRAIELGLGTCYIAWFNKQKLKDFLGIPKNHYVLTICVGYPDEKPSSRPRKNLKDIVFKEKYKPK